MNCKTFLFRRKTGKKVEYVICAFTLCADVLEGVLQFGTRRKLLKLESVGRQFRYVIVNRFVERPFLVLESLGVVYEESIYNDKDAIEDGDGYNRFKQILSAPGGVPVLETDDEVPKILFR